MKFRFFPSGNEVWQINEDSWPRDILRLRLPNHFFSGRGKEADSPSFSSLYWNCVKKNICFKKRQGWRLLKFSVTTCKSDEFPLI